MYNNFMKTINFTSIDDLIKQNEEIKNKSVYSTPASMSKESEPISSTSENIEYQEAIDSKVEEEVKPFVASRQETIELPPDLHKIGLKPVPATKYQSYKNVKLPLSDDKVLMGLHAPITSSFRWMATLAIYILRKAHLTLKKVHGHVVRVAQ